MMLDQIISIKRLTRDLDNPNKEMYVDNMALQQVKCNLQPATGEDTAIADGVFAQTYICYTTQSGLLPGDLATVFGTGQTYRIKGIEDWSQTDLIPHFEAIFVKFEDEQQL